MAEEFLPLYDPVTITLLVLSLIGMLLVSVVVSMMYTQRELPLMNDENLTVNLLLLVALVGSFGSALVFIGKPTNNVCSLRETFPCVMLSLAITCMLAKCTRIVFAFKGIVLLFVSLKLHMKPMFYQNCVNFSIILTNAEMIAYRIGGTKRPKQTRPAETYPWRLPMTYPWPAIK